MHGHNRKIQLFLGNTNGGYGDANATNITTPSANNAGNTRKLANHLASLTSSTSLLWESKDLGTLQGNDTDGWSAQITDVAPGLYVIVDTLNNTVTTNLSVPMIVGTAPVGNGEINIKNVDKAPNAPTKTIDGHQYATAGIGETKTATITIDMTGVAANQLDSEWAVHDVPSAGLEIVSDTFKVNGEQCGTAFDATKSCWSEASSPAGSYDIHLNMPKITLDDHQKFTVTYSEKLTDDVLQNDLTGAPLTGHAVSNVHAAKNTATVSHNGVASAPSIAYLGVTDFRIKKIWSNNTPATGATFTIKTTKNGHDEYLQGITHGELQHMISPRRIRVTTMCISSGDCLMALIQLQRQNLLTVQIQH